MHGPLLNFAVETGLVGLTAFSALCAVSLTSVWRWRQHRPPASRGGGLATAILAAMVTMLANQLVDDTILSGHIGFEFYALLTTAAAAERYLSTPEGRGASAPVGRYPAPVVGPSRES